MSEELLNRAIALARAGKKEEARSLLEPLLEADRQNITAWLWYVDTWPDDDQRIRVLEICLRYNPNHPTIQRALTLLRSRQKLPPPRSSTSLSQPASPTTQEQIESIALTPHAGTSPPLLDQRVEEHVQAGWQIVYRTSTTAQLKKTKQWNSGCLVVSAIFLVVGFIFSPVLGGIGLFLLLLAVIDYALKKDKLIYLTEEQLRKEYKRAEKQRQREEAARRAEQDRIRELKRRKEIRKQNKRSKSSAKRIMGLPPKQFRILAILGGVTFLLVVVAIGLSLMLPH